MHQLRSVVNGITSGRRSHFWLVAVSCGVSILTGWSLVGPRGQRADMPHNTVKEQDVVVAQGNDAGGVLDFFDLPANGVLDFLASAQTPPKQLTSRKCNGPRMRS